MSSVSLDYNGSIYGCAMSDNNLYYKKSINEDWTAL